ncbi:MAG: sugar ABC transporter substrate-binding protein [Desulfobacterales bacterium]|nr:MAG: sugar ABC transporter substrate-binding protein [Desulfobacterales bacterium]
MKRCNWKALQIALIAVFALALVFPVVTEAKDWKLAISQGWLDNDSGQNMNKGYKKGIKEFFGDKALKDAKFVNSNYDTKLQSEQIEAFIKMKPDALFVTASEAAAITPAVKRAIEAGIPVFSGDSLISGTGCTTSVLSNNFGMGMLTGQWIAEQLNGKGKIGVIGLPANETWDHREQGLDWILKEYPGIQVVARWNYDPAGAVTPRQGIDNMLAANPKKGDLDAIWCAWDGAAMEGALAIKNAGREKEIFTTGIDGGTRAFQYIKGGKTSMKFTAAQSMWLMAYQSVFYASEYLKGNKVPRLVISPVYAITAKELEKVDIKKYGDTYDHPGNAQKLGWKRSL